ncbi:SDR family NAD(P)-dependent oxidoreductase [Cytophagaceae bacterium ABcell3]|nr:SDR family NAD(P)-dependent oxidoreductase [Cytophagaceae bacterium ABcell3]
MDLQGKAAVVTGASKGIGLALVNALLAEGIKVAGWSRSGKGVSNENYKTFQVDISSYDSVEKAWASSVDFLGQQPDILINNAGLGYSGLLEDMEPALWKEIFEVNVNGLFYCSKMAIAGMKSRGEGHIINIASIAGKDGSPKLSAYCGSKFAVRGISQSLYKEVRDYGVKVTCVMPGSVKTDFFDNIDHIQANDYMMKAEDVAEMILHIIKTPENLHATEIELRPLMPAGRKKV